MNYELDPRNTLAVGKQRADEMCHKRPISLDRKCDRLKTQWINGSSRSLTKSLSGRLRCPWTKGSCTWLRRGHSRIQVVIPDQRARAAVSKAILTGHGRCRHQICRCLYPMSKLTITNATNQKRPHSTNWSRPTGSRSRAKSNRTWGIHYQIS